MIFYNPFFSKIPPFPFYKSTSSSKNVNNVQKKINSVSCVNGLNVSDSTSCVDSFICNKSVSDKFESTVDNKKSNHHFPLSIGKLNDYSQETDSLILLALLYFLYTQKSSSSPLMICLLLLLLED